MTLIFKKPTGTGLILKRPVGAQLELTPTNLLPDDPNAIAYITAVEAADGQALEPATRLVYNKFVKGCKADGTWPALKASCILAGARTLAGALVPLVGPAPTNINFVDGNYNRKTGLKGDGSTKYLNANRNNNLDGQDNFHRACYIKEASNQNAINVQIGGGISGAGCMNLGMGALTQNFTRGKTNAVDTTINAGSAINFYGISRSNSAQYNLFYNSTSYTRSALSDGNQSAPTAIFARTDGVSILSYTNARISFYSIGDFLNLNLLDARLATLMADLAASIP